LTAAQIQKIDEAITARGPVASRTAV
jgi:hypothetical protein